MCQGFHTQSYFAKRFQISIYIVSIEAEKEHTEIATINQI